jgi:hypothetical protein
MIAAQTLAKALNGGSSGLSERELCDRWLTGMRAEPTLLPEGWYTPPPDGLSALIGDPPEFGRMSYVSLRHPDIWPRADISISGESLLYVYASPVDRDTKMIGDLGVTLYRGTDQRIRRHLSACLEITGQLAEFTAVDMELRDIYHRAAELMRDTGLSNETYSTTDVSGGLDVGHTIPWSYCEPTDPELAAVQSREPARICADFGPVLQAFGMTKYLPAVSLRALECTEEKSGDGQRGLTS